MQLLSAEYILAAFLIFIRVSSLIMSAPYFSSASFPARVKLFFALTTTFILSFSIPAENIMLPVQSEAAFWVTAIVSEALIGIAMGLVGQLVFAGIEMGGRLISLKTTLTFAQIVNTVTQQKTDIVGNLFSMLSILVFLAMDGDKIYIKGLVKSFEVIPLYQAELAQTGPFMLEVANYLFIVAVQIAAPFLVVLFIIDLSLAIFSRVMPQANIMFIALPIKIFLGFTMLLWVTPHLPDAFSISFNNLFDYLVDILEIMAP